MAALDVNPRYREALAGLGLAAAGDFLRLSGVIYSGHPDRHVARVTLGDGPGALTAFLKKEHRVPRRDRLAAAWAGFGFVSKSRREFAVLAALRQAEIGCPEPLAAGEDGGRAFLLLRAVEDALELRAFLAEHAERPHLRRAVARQLGAELARIHAAGFDHPDLYSKHVLVDFDHDTARARFSFLDWQRSRRRHRLSWSRRWRDLGALDATLADDLAGARDRLACLHAYLRRCAAVGGARRLPALWRAVCKVCRRTAVLRRKRRIRELRRPPLAAGVQNLVWVDGEALCLTRQFLDALGGRPPAYLVQPGDDPPGKVARVRVPVPGPGWAVLVRRSACRPWRWLAALLRGRPLTSPELEQAGTLYLLQRYGITPPTVLAVGQRHVRPWQMQSFLLTQPPRAAAGLFTWLAGGNAGRSQVLRDAGDVLRRLHEACCYLADCSEEEMAGLFLVQTGGAGGRVVVGSAAGLRRAHRPSPRRACKDLRRLLLGIGRVCGRASALRTALTYLGCPHVTHEIKGTVRRVLPPAAGAKRSRPASPQPEVLS
jgi:hypothetical protein